MLSEGAPVGVPASGSSADIGAATTVPGIPGGNGSSDTSDFQEEIDAELAEGNYSSLFEVAQDAMAQQGYTVEKTETINDIPCAFFSNEDDYGIVFMDQSDSVMEVVYLTGGDVRNNDTVQAMLHSVRWAG